MFPFIERLSTMQNVPLEACQLRYYSSLGTPDSNGPIIRSGDGVLHIRRVSNGLRIASVPLQIWVSCSIILYVARNQWYGPKLKRITVSSVSGHNIVNVAPSLCSPRVGERCKRARLGSVRTESWAVKSDTYSNGRLWLNTWCRLPAKVGHGHDHSVRNEALT